MKVPIQLMNEYAKVPEYKTEGAAGFDLVATQYGLLHPQNFVVIDTAIGFEIPQGYELQIRGRSGLAFKHGVVPFYGTIDADYRGSVKVLLFNFSNEPFYVSVGDRIAQGIISKVEQVDFVVVDQLEQTKRGDKGFGSTGRN